MGALLNHAAAVKHGDLITEFAGGEAVADEGVLCGDVLLCG